MHRAFAIFGLWLALMVPAVAHAAVNAPAPHRTSAIRFSPRWLPSTRPGWKPPLYEAKSACADSRPRGPGATIESPWHPTAYPELDQVSLLVPTGTGSPPLRFQCGYTNVSIGHSRQIGPEECPFLTSITVPSPTGTGSATAGIQYAPDTYVVAALTDGNRSPISRADNHQPVERRQWG